MKKSGTSSSHRTEKLINPSALREEFPIEARHVDFIERSRDTIKEILDGKDQRLLLIAGPCSIHDTTAALEYARKLQNLAKEISETIYLVMRVYFEKPRTVVGWKGIMHDPDLDSSGNLNKGLRITRKLLLDIASLEVPAAAEFLDPNVPVYIEDLIAWGCIGARTSESQTHRQMASSLTMPIAFKNNTDGNVEIAINGILSALSKHSYIGCDSSGQLCIIHTEGNLYGHIVLRGGDKNTNYDPYSVSMSLDSLKNAGLPPRVLIDCAHANSNKNHYSQIQVFHSIVNQIIEGNKEIRGILIESHLEAGNQSIASDLSMLKYGVSLTDPCLEWAATEELLLWAHKKLRDQGAELNEEQCVGEVGTLCY